MEAPPEKPYADPSGETGWRRVKNGETILSNSLETNMEPPWNEGDLIGDYRIGKLLGRGKAGFVYGADDLLARRRCALKVLCRMSSYDLVRNKMGFRRMSPFRHPCLMRTDRIDVIDGRHVLSMEEIDGETLYEAVRRYSLGPKQEAYRKLQSLLHDYALGLAMMHFAGLVHRDIKPTNLMVRKDGHGVIVDYGLVTNNDPETDPFGIRPYIAGTPRYFSPEALWDQSYIPAGDVFSLGLVMLDCLNEVSRCDRWLRQGNFEDWVRDEDEQVIADAVKDLDQQIPALLRKAVGGMLSGDRSHRPSSIDVVEMTGSDDNPIRLVGNQHVFGREAILEECDGWIRDIYRGETGRLHLYGEAGAGKTRVLDELERQLRRNQWGQVFRVKCRSRENQTMQVMDQIADQIANRYARGDRERLKLDQVSWSILVQSFPQLRHVLEVDLRDVPESFAGAPQRVDALTAALRLSRELRKVGPLIVIIDDAQWSDHDSNTVWDELQNDTKGALGIITSSRNPETNQRQKADKRIHIGPLSRQAAFDFLQNASQRWNANINIAGLEDLVEISRCNAFRLQELAEEFRPEGMLHRVKQSDDASISNLGEIDRLWKTRFSRLSEDAKCALGFIVTAEAPVSIAQLAELTGLEHVDASVSQLVQQRLVNDDATGKECITIVHDKIADGLIENLDEANRRQSHLDWAKLLSRGDRARDFAARIASHYYAAGDKGSALPYAITAAENADKSFAKAEAGMWHERVLEQVAGDARDKHLRDAARCYHEADLPDKASKLYLRLAENTESVQEKRQFEILAVQLLVRSGQMDLARPLMSDLSRRLGVRTDRLTDVEVHESVQRLVELSKGLCRVDARHIDICPSAFDATQCSADQRARLDLCVAIGRPMAMLGIRTALPLVIQGGELSVQHGRLAERIHFGSMAGVWNAILSGGDVQVMQSVREMLFTVRDQTESMGNHLATGEAWSGIAYLETLGMRWGHVADAVDAGIRCYASESTALPFEISHTRWLHLWADWQLGRWDEMRSISYDMVADAERRNDSYQQLLATSGFGGNAFLITGDVSTLQRLDQSNKAIVTDTGEVEFADFFGWMQGLQIAIYQGDFGHACDLIESMRTNLQSSLLWGVPLVHVTFEFFSALVSLHVQQSPMDAKTDAVAKMEQSSVAWNSIQGLRKHPGDYASALTNLLEGIQLRIQGETEKAYFAFQDAVESASRAGVFPFQLAAEDAILQLRKPGAEIDSLRSMMTTRRVADPLSLERLYTVRPAPTEQAHAAEAMDQD